MLAAGFALAAQLDQVLARAGGWVSSASAEAKLLATEGAQVVSAEGNQLLQFTQQGQANAGGSASDNSAGSGNLDPNKPWIERELTEQEVQQFTKESTHRGGSKTTVLGHFKPPAGPNHIEAAKAQDASYFNMPENLRSGLWSANQWELNKQFLRDAVARGDRIMIGTEIDTSHPEIWLFREINILKEEYHLVLQDGVFVPEQ
jgi:hypothetical protein